MNILNAVAYAECTKSQEDVEEAKLTLEEYYRDHIINRDTYKCVCIYLDSLLSLNHEGNNIEENEYE